MLNDKNFTVLLYEQNGASIFPNTEIKGGVAITLRNKNREYGEIGFRFLLLDMLQKKELSPVQEYWNIW